MTKRGSLYALLLASIVATTPAAAQQERPLRLTMNTELQILDPIVTPSVVTRAFGFMVWDTLVSPDSRGEMRPQMLEGWQVSDDRMTWTFRLREGLEWHDGTPVTAEDCVASLRRWAQRDGLGRQLMAAAREWRVVDQRSFVLVLARPFGQVIQALGKTATPVPFMMPARLASTPPTTQVPEVVGSGPFLFRREDWRMGDRVPFTRNPRYRPRAEPADGLSGGKTVHIERAEFVSLPDSTTRVAALQTGEIDYLERVPLDFVERLRRDRNLVVTPGMGPAQIFGVLTLNHTQPPFNDIRARRALQAAIEQPEVMAGLGLPSGMYQEHCSTIYMCGTPFASEDGADRLRNPGPQRARSLLQEAGYANQPVVVLHSQDSALINPITLVAVEQMRRAGFNIDMRTTDWSTVAQRRTSRQPVEQGGWNVVPLVWTGFDMEDPSGNPVLVHNCSNAYPGWWCDERQRALLEAFLAESDPARQRELAAQLQAMAHEHVSVVILGQFASPGAYRANLRGLLDVGFPVLWNIQRAGR